MTKSIFEIENGCEVLPEIETGGDCRNSTITAPVNGFLQFDGKKHSWLKSCIY